MIQGQHDAQRRHQPAVGVAGAHAQIDRRLIWLAEPGHDASERLHRHVERRLAHLAEAAVPGIGSVHQTWIDRAELLVAELPAVEQLDPHIGEEHIGLLDEAVHDVATCRLLQVERHALLVAIDHQEVLVPITDRHRLDAAHSAALIAALRPFDLDDLGTEVGEMLRRHRPLEPHGEVDDANAF